MVISELYNLDLYPESLSRDDLQAITVFHRIAALANDIAKYCNFLCMDYIQPIMRHDLYQFHHNRLRESLEDIDKELRSFTDTGTHIVKILNHEV